MKSLGPRRMYFPIHPSSRQCTDKISSTKLLYSLNMSTRRLLSPDGHNAFKWSQQENIENRARVSLLGKGQGGAGERRGEADFKGESKLAKMLLLPSPQTRAALYQLYQLQSDAALSLRIGLDLHFGGRQVREFECLKLGNAAATRRCLG